MVLRTVRFLSTPSARRATYISFCYLLHTLNFYPRPPRGGRQITTAQTAADKAFLSTPSARRATAPDRWNILATWYFYPRPPRGGRHRPTPRPDPGSNFYPRPPRGGRLAGRANGWDTTLDFYPRPPRGGRPVVMPTHWLMGYFYPRPPRGGRRRLCGCRQLLLYFYPRPPRGGRQTAVSTAVKGLIFLSTPSARRATHGMR